MSIPKKIRLSDEQEFSVRQVIDLESLGYFDRSTGEVAIRKNQPEIGKHIILIHEMIHFAAELCVQSGATKRQPDEAFVTNAAPLLLNLLIGAGLYRGNVTQSDLHEFMASGARD